MKYAVIVAYTTFVDYEVEAEDEQEAREFYIEQGEEVDRGDPEADVRSVVPAPVPGLPTTEREQK